MFLSEVRLLLSLVNRNGVDIKYKYKNKYSK